MDVALLAIAVCDAQSAKRPAATGHRSPLSPWLNARLTSSNVAGVLTGNGPPMHKLDAMCRVHNWQYLQFLANAERRTKRARGRVALQRAWTI